MVKGPNSFGDHRLWLELFVLVNLLGLAPDIFLAHSTNSFRDWTEYVPLVYSIVAPWLLLLAIAALAFLARMAAWRRLGGFVGWTSIAVGIIGLVLHLEITEKRPNYARAQAAMKDLCSNCHGKSGIRRTVCGPLVLYRHRLAAGHEPDGR